MENHFESSGTSKLMITISQMSGVYNTSRSQLIFNTQNKKLCFQRLTDSRNRTLEKILSHSTMPSMMGIQIL